MMLLLIMILRLNSSSILIELLSLTVMGYYYFKNIKVCDLNK